MKKIGIVIFFIFLYSNIFAQFTYGTTGLLNAPSAEMQDDKTFIIGGGYLNEKMTSKQWNYGTYNYYLNVTILPFLEVAYTATMFKAKTIGIDWKVDPEKFCNQDRYFSARLRVLKEGQFWEYMPAVVFGTSDPYTEASGGQVGSEAGNGYFSRFYAVATKHFSLGSERIGFSLAYIYNFRRDFKYNGIAAGITYNPSFLPNLRLIVEHNSRDFAAGMTYVFFKRFHLQAQLQKFKYFSGGINYVLHLK